MSTYQKAVCWIASCSLFEGYYGYKWREKMTINELNLNNKNVDYRNLSAI